MGCGDKESKCKCPYCESELEMKCFEPAFCEPCNKKLVKCPACGEMVNEHVKKCPKCFTVIKKG